MAKDKKSVFSDYNADEYKKDGYKTEAIEVPIKAPEMPPVEKKPDPPKATAFNATPVVLEEQIIPFGVDGTTHEGNSIRAQDYAAANGWDKVELVRCTTAVTEFRFIKFKK